MEHLQRGAGGYDWVMLSNPRNRDRGELESLVREWRAMRPGTAGGRTLFITVMKQKNHLQNLTALLQSVRLNAIPALVFDDEADQASLNTRPLDPSPSTIYQCIHELRRAIPHHTLLQYTATPQAPLLISRIDSLSADFADVISPGNSYTGGQTFFQTRLDDLVEEIPQDEIIDDQHLPAEAPESLIYALAVYFVGVACGYVNGPARGNRSMLVHPHHTRPVHDWCLRTVQELQRDWTELLSRPGDPDHADLMRLLERAHADLASTEPSIPLFGELRQYLVDAVQRTVPRLVNSNDGREVHWENAYSHILVGGEKLGRGYTVRGLTVTYMPRGPGSWNADTIQQRARFFGYHAAYLGLCRVFLHPDVLDVYQAYLAHEEDVRRKIRDHRGQSLKSLRRSFILDVDLRPTRHNVLATLYERPLRTEWFEQRWPHATPQAVIENQRLVTSLRRMVRLQPDPSYPQHRRAIVDLRSLVANFLIPYICADDRDETSMYAITAALNSYARDNADALCQLYFMSYGETRYRQQGAKTNEIALMQGRSSAGSDRYPGDRAFCDKEITTVQVHTLNIGRASRTSSRPLFENVAATAIRLPDLLRRQLENMIVQPRG
jgi:hypothetical protein